MEIQNNCCTLCGRSTSVIVPPQSKKITSIISTLLTADELIHEEFESINNKLKACPSCLQDLVFLKKQQKKFRKIVDSDDKCSVCHETDHLILIRSSQSDDAVLAELQGLLVHRSSKVCIACIRSFQVLRKIKHTLLRIFPHLSPKSQLRAEKHQELSEVSNYLPYKISKPRTKIWNSHFEALRHLCPLRYSNYKYNIDKYKDDPQLFNQVPLINLSPSDRLAPYQKSHRAVKSRNVSSPVPHAKHNFFKIKLKPMHKKQRQRVVESLKPSGLVPDKVSFDKRLMIRIKRLENVETLNEVDVGNSTERSQDVVPQEDLTASGKRKKSVTFAEENVEIEYGNFSPKRPIEENDDVTPLKPSLKKRKLNDADLNDSLNDVEYIKKNNDTIFDGLKETEPELHINNENDAVELILNGDNCEKKEKEVIILEDGDSETTEIYEIDKPSETVIDDDDELTEVEGSPIEKPSKTVTDDDELTEVEENSVERPVDAVTDDAELSEIEENPIERPSETITDDAELTEVERSPVEKPSEPVTDDTELTKVKENTSKEVHSEIVANEQNRDNVDKNTESELHSNEETKGKPEEETVDLIEVETKSDLGEEKPSEVPSNTDISTSNNQCQLDKPSIEDSDFLGLSIVDSDSETTSDCNGTGDKCNSDSGSPEKKEDTVKNLEDTEEDVPNGVAHVSEGVQEQVNTRCSVSTEN